tara:strand:- start:246 stop:524 length:279 start_codon:yes stop_codon:yes gene_type:complete
MGKNAPQAPPPAPQPAPTPPPDPVVKPKAAETEAVTPKTAIGASAQGGYSGTGKGKARTVLTGAGGAMGATPVRKPMLTGTLGSAYKTTLGG